MGTKSKTPVKKGGKSIRTVKGDKKPVKKKTTNQKSMVDDDKDAEAEKLLAEKRIEEERL